MRFLCEGWPKAHKRGPFSPQWNRRFFQTGNWETEMNPNKRATKNTQSQEPPIQLEAGVTYTGEREEEEKASWVFIILGK